MSQFAKWDVQAAEILDEPLLTPGVQLVSQLYWMTKTQKRITEQRAKALEPFTPPSCAGVFYVVVTESRIVFFKVIVNFFTVKELGKVVLELPRNAFMNGNGLIQVEKSGYSTVHLKFMNKGVPTHYIMRCKGANMARFEQNRLAWQGLAQ